MEQDAQKQSYQNSPYSKRSVSWTSILTSQLARWRGISGLLKETLLSLQAYSSQIYSQSTIMLSELAKIYPVCYKYTHQQLTNFAREYFSASQLQLETLSRISYELYQKDRVFKQKGQELLIRFHDFEEQQAQFQDLHEMLDGVYIRDGDLQEGNEAQIKEQVGELALDFNKCAVQIARSILEIFKNTQYEAQIVILDEDCKIVQGDSFDQNLIKLFKVMQASGRYYEVYLSFIQFMRKMDAQIYEHMEIITGHAMKAVYNPECELLTSLCNGFRMLGLVFLDKSKQIQAEILECEANPCSLQKKSLTNIQQQFAEEIKQHVAKQQKSLQSIRQNIPKTTRNILKHQLKSQIATINSTFNLKIQKHFQNLLSQTTQIQQSCQKATTLHTQALLQINNSIQLQTDFLQPSLQILYKPAYINLEKSCKRSPDTYLCMLKQKFPLQGRLYITHELISFFSMFTTRNLLTRDRLIEIYFKDIQFIQKRKSGLIFNKGLTIQCNDTLHEFFIYGNRDEVYQKITELRRFYQPNEPNIEVEQAQVIINKDILPLRQLMRRKISQKTHERPIETVQSQTNTPHTSYKEAQS